jgi:DNA-binding NarL/FixJ family response regulator
MTTSAQTEQLIQNTRFIVVDDNAGRSAAIERYLLMAAARQVRKAASPIEALRVLQDPRTPTDCVICAQELKPMTGLEFLQNIRAGRYGAKSLSEIKFILVLNRPDEALLRSAAPWRLNGHVVGRFDRDIFTQTVDQAIRKTVEAAPDAGVLELTEEIPPGAARLPVAHISAQGVDLVIVPLDPQFAEKAQADQQFVEALRESTRRANLKGEVVPVWEMAEGGMAFIAPKGFHPYFRSINLQFVQANLNRAIHLAVAV